MLSAVIAVAVTALVVTIWLLAIANHANPGTDQANARLDAVRTGLAAGAGAGAAVGLMLAFRRQHHQEITTAQTDHDATERRITELYTKAVEQLGNDKAPVRLGGLYALERLSQDNETQRQTIVNVICAYLRMPFSPQPPVVMPAPNGTADASEVRTGTEANPGADTDAWQQEKQVRLTAQRILADHLRKPDDNQRWVSHSTTRFWDQISLDLTGATLIDFATSPTAKSPETPNSMGRPSAAAPGSTGRPSPGAPCSRTRRPVVDGGAAILAHRFSRHFAHPTQQPYRPFFHVARVGRDPELLAEAERTAAGNTRAIESYRAGMTVHPLLPFRDWNACQPALGRLGAVLVAGAADATTVRQLGFVPTHGLGAALDLARGRTSGDARIGFLLSPPYFPLRVRPN